MAFKGILAVAAAVATLLLVSPESARAFDRDRADVPAGWVGVRDVRHWVYYPRYRHYYLTHGESDPFAYRSVPTGYYPYYNSGYWKHASQVPLKRAHFKAPRYYAAWGANKKHYNHVEWHTKHHGGHRHGHW
jgi:hypothetical protein